LTSVEGRSLASQEGNWWKKIRGRQAYRRRALGRLIKRENFFRNGGAYSGNSNERVKLALKAAPSRLKGRGRQG